MRIKVLSSIVLSIIFIIIFSITSNANEITKNATIFLNESSISSKVIDNNELTYIKISDKDVIKISSNNTIGGLYIIYEVESKNGVLETNGEKIKIGENGFLHEYINLSGKKVKELIIKYESDLKISDIYILDEGTLPDFVEVWEKPCEKADIMLFSSHADDEQLFFLGLLPNYVARGANVQVIYFTYHENQTIRYHEQLHGLYTVGIRNYPIIGIVPDAYSTNLESAIQNMQNSGITEEEALKFKVEMIRRFKPQVIVGQDEKGEYSHGQHILNTYLLEKAIILSNDKKYDMESFNKYGTWNVLKLYLHLYEQNQIIMDYDTPLDYFGGKTAYEVSKEGYSKHNSQQWTWFTKWINGSNNNYTKATEIQKYSPVKFGLYYKSIEEDDKNKNDFLENITLYSEQEKLEKNKLEEIAKEKQKHLEDENSKNEVFFNRIKYTVLVFILIVLIVFFIKIIVRNKKK